MTTLIHSPKLFVIFGPPGSGKGTQSRLLSKEFQIPIISTGDLLRAIASNSDSIKHISIVQGTIREKIATIINAGGLVNDELVLELVKQELENEKYNKGFILDGFPRNINQADQLEVMLNSRYPGAHPVINVINLVVTHEEIINRVVGRFICKNCGEVYHKVYRNTSVPGVCDNCHGEDFYIRQDDIKDVIDARLKQYDKLTKPLIEHYSKTIIQIDGMQPQHAVFDAILTEINDLAKQHDKICEVI